MVFIWISVFVISLALLIKGADWFLAAAEKIGLAAGLSPFIVGMIIVGMGTSFPELISSFAAVMGDVTEIVVANAVGSNIANIFLIVGVSAILARRLAVSKNLIDLDLPLLASSTVIILGVLADRQVTFVESAILIIMYLVYLVYATNHTDSHKEKERKVGEYISFILPSRKERRYRLLVSRKEIADKVKLIWKDAALMIIGLLALIGGAKYLVDSVVELSSLLNIGVGAISVVAISFGTSLPELFVSGSAAIKKKYEVALGTIFGSNVFNALVVIGLPGLFANLSVDEKTFTVGIPTLALATLLFVITGISKKVYVWEGIFFVALYVLFVGKVFALF